MAFDPDIKGVCNIGETLVIISNPTNIAKTNIVIILIRSNIVSIVELKFQFTLSGEVWHLAVMSYGYRVNNLVIHIEMQSIILF